MADQTNLGKEWSAVDGGSGIGGSGLAKRASFQLPRLLSSRSVRSTSADTTTPSELVLSKTLPCLGAVKTLQRGLQGVFRLFLLAPQE